MQQTHATCNRQPATDTMRRAACNTRCNEHVCSHAALPGRCEADPGRPRQHGVLLLVVSGPRRCLAQRKPEASSLCCQLLGGGSVQHTTGNMTPEPCAADKRLSESLPHRYTALRAFAWSLVLHMQHYRGACRGTYQNAIRRRQHASVWPHAQHATHDLQQTTLWEHSGGRNIHRTCCMQGEGSKVEVELEEQSEGSSSDL